MVATACWVRAFLARPRRCALRVGAVIGGVLVVALASSAWAGGQLVTKQAKSNPRLGKLGYTVDVDTRWSEQQGYRPLRIKIAPAEPRNVERRFTVVARLTAARGYRDGGSVTTVEKRVTIPAVEDLTRPPPPTTATLSVPQTEIWQSVDLEFWENGTHRPDLDCNQHLGNGGWWGGPRRADMPLALRIDSNASAGTTFPQHNQGGRGGSQWSNGNQTYYGFNLKLVTALPEFLPDEWIDLTSLDVVVMQATELERLMAAAPAKWQALRRWVAAGGNLWITGIVTSQQQRDDRTGAIVNTFDWSRLTALDRLLASGESGARAAPWTTEEVGKSRPLGLGQVLAVAEGNRNYAPASVEFQSQDVTLWLSTPSNTGQSWQKVPVGPRSPPSNAATTPFDTERLSWESRMGLDPQDPTAGFFYFIIPGVGQVPIYAFLGLMTGFVVFIGPLNYIYLRRRAKLHLMLVTVPVCAALVTLGLYTYALASDGLGTRVRVRSYTELDQRRGEAVCWSRLCYYAGLAPSQGLVFSGDVAVIPVPADMDSRRESEARQVVWTADGQQHLSSGWLRSRTLTQYFTARARHSEAGLEFTPAEAGRLKAANRLGTAVEHLLVCDADAKLHYAEGLPKAGESEMQPVDDASGPARVIGQAFSDHRLQSADPYTGGAPLNQPRVAMKVAPTPQPFIGPVVSRMEAGLAAALQRASDGKLEPRSYVAIVERSPEVELGLPSADEEAGFHVIVGRW